MSASPAQIKAKEKKWREVQGLWEADLSFPEIAERMGWSASHLAVQTNKMRRAGWDLPLRNVKGQGPRKHRKHGRPKGRP
jgi:hypothetical protein